MYVYAREHGISEEQLIIKEYITQNSKGNEEIFKGIYEKLDSKIGQYEATIEQLTGELDAAKKDELPYQQLASEISATYPEVKHIYLGQGAHISIDSLKVSPCLLLKVHTDTLMSESSVEQLKKWVKVRLQVENVEIENHASLNPAE